MTNKALKIAMFEREATHKQAAEMLGINARVFTNKINKRIINGYEASFTPAEKTMLAAQYQINVNEIQ